MNKLIFLLATTLCFNMGFSQTKPRNQAGISLSWQNFRFHDRHSSPLAYGTNSLFPKVGLFYNKQTDRSIFNISVKGSVGKIHPSRFGARGFQSKLNENDSFQYVVSSKFIHADIEADYFRKINSLSTEKFNYWVGGTLNESAYYADEVANTPWLLNVADIAPGFQMNYLPASNHNITLKVDLSVLGVITRPVYALFPKSNKDKNVPAYFKQGTKVSSLNGFQKFNFQIGYQYQVVKNFAVGLEYRLKWMHYKLPKNINTVDKSFEVKLAYTY